MSIQPRRTAQGDRRYDVRLRRPDGTVYTRTFRTRKEAEAFERAELAARDRGTWTDPEAGKVALADYANAWLVNRTVRGRPLAPRSTELYRYVLDRFLLPGFGDLALSKIKADDVRRWHGTLVRTAPKSVPPKAYRLLHAIFATAVEDGLVAVNPVRIKSAGGERPDERPTLGPEHVAALATAIEPRWRAMILLAAYGALRFGELIGLRRRDVDLLHGHVIIEGQIVELSGGQQIRSAPKSAAGRRRVSLPAFVTDELEHHLDTYVDADPDGHLFTGERGGVPTRTNWARTWATAREAAGLPETIHLHDLRHAGATLAAQVGATTKELMARLGHASARASLIYQHAAEHRDRIIADALDDVARPAHDAQKTPDSRAMDARWTRTAATSDSPPPRPNTA